MLKITRSLDEPASSRNNGSKLTSNKNDNTRLASGNNNGNSEVDRFGDNGVKYVKKSGKSKY